jgi:putative Mg2+ transporter-C (MgtC) family protein
MIVAMNLPALPEWDWPLLVEHAERLAVAWLLVLPVAWMWERLGHSAGLRTFPLVSVAACGYMLAVYGFHPGDPGDLSRALQGLIAGVGFIGGGAILKYGTTVHGTATAASIWTAAAIGVAAGVGRFELALLLSLFNLLTVSGLSPLKRLATTAKKRKSAGDHPPGGDESRPK